VFCACKIGSGKVEITNNAAATRTREKAMLACVSTLTDVVSYKDVRHSKEWLTSHETINYIRENCPAIWAIMKGRNSPRYNTIYSWAKEISYDPRHRWHAPLLKMIRVKDDGCRSVNFWCVKTLDEEEKRMAKELKNPPTSVHQKDCMHNARVRFLGKEETQRLEDIYDNLDFVGLCKLCRELYGQPEQSEHGSFYDPEWFS
jgi:hypothetical protein